MSANETDDGRTVITCACGATVEGRDFAEAAERGLRAGWDVPTSPKRADICPACGGEGRSMFVDTPRPDVVAHCPVPR